MSRLTVRIAPRARRQILAAVTWWQENRTAAPGLFSEEIDRAFQLVSENPSIDLTVPSSRFPALRRLSTGKSGYWLYYQPASGAIEVLAVWHQSRGRGPRL